MPLDDGVELLGRKLHLTQFHKFRQLLAKDRPFVGYIRFCLARGANTLDSASLRKSDCGSISKGAHKRNLWAGEVEPSIAKADMSVVSIARTTYSGCKSKFIEFV